MTALGQHPKVATPGSLLPLLPHIAEGLTNAQIARRLCLAEEGVRSRVPGVLWLLGVDSRVAAVSQAYRRGLLDPATGQLTDAARALMAQHPANTQTIHASGVNAAPAGRDIPRIRERKNGHDPNLSAVAVSAPD